MKEKGKQYFRIIDENFGFPPTVMDVLNLIGYATMALPFAAIVGFLLLGIWSVNVLRDFFVANFVTIATTVPMIATALKLVMALAGARSIFLGITILPPCLPEFIERVRKELRKDLDM